jgi:hypothetical protein
MFDLSDLSIELKVVISIIVDRKGNLVVLIIVLRIYRYLLLR